LQGSPLGDRISVLEEPWALFSFAEAEDRVALADEIRDREIDVVIIGPVTAAGMMAAGTVKEVRDFFGLVVAVGCLSRRRVTFILVHHENKGGAVSGAWEGVGDTLFHVSLQGHGRTQVYIQKARWSSEHHGTTMRLNWADGDGFEREDKPEFDAEQLAAQILAYVCENPGTGWTRVEEATPGIGREARRGVRDRLLQAGRLLNVGHDVDGLEAALDHVPERKPARLYLPEHADVLHLRPAPGAAQAQAANGSAPCAPALIRAQGVGAAATAPDDELEKILNGDPGVEFDDWADHLEEPDLDGQVPA
jgi:hypothetical protein